MQREYEGASVPGGLRDEIMGLEDSDSARIRSLQAAVVELPQVPDFPDVQPHDLRPFAANGPTGRGG